MKGITRKGILTMIGFLGGVALAANTLPNGLQLERFEVSTPGPASVGAKVRVTMTLKNLEPSPIRFAAQPGLFIACRVNSTSDANNMDFGHQRPGLVLGGGQRVTIQAERVLDRPGEWRFWPGFKLVNGAYAPFRWMEKTLLVSGPAPGGSRATGGTLGDRLSDALDGFLGSTLQVRDLLASPSRYDGKTVVVEANALVVRRQQGGLLVSLADTEEAKRVLTAFGPGPTSAGNTDKVRASGIFRAKSPRGRYTYDNEIELGPGGLTVVEKGFFGERASSQPILDLRDQVRSPFNLGLLQGGTVPVGSACSFHFHIRAYTNSPRAYTVVKQGKGEGAVSVRRAEYATKLGGRGMDGPGAGNTWLCLHVALRGNGANYGQPASFCDMPMGADPTPGFFLVDRGGKVYRIDGTMSTAVIYRTKGYVRSDDVALNDPTWKNSALVFKVPQGIQQPTLLVVTWTGGSSYEFRGVRLF